MRGFNYCRVLLFLTFFFASNAFAVEYYWLAAADPTHRATPLAVCSSIPPGYNGYNWSNYSVVRQSDTLFYCKATRHSLDGSASWAGITVSGYNANRYGDSCPPDHVFNSTTGACDGPPPDECEIKAGQPHPFTKTGNSGDAYAVVVNGYVIANQSACFSGCAVNTVDQKCTGRVSGAFACTGTGYFTGQNCEVSGDGSLIDENTTAEPEPEPKTIADQVPCTYTTQPDGTQACESLISEEREGQYCGTVNGVKKCVDSKPTKNGLSVLTTVSSVTDANGKTVTTKKDTATVTKCTGANQCSSTSATTTTVTTTNGNGDVESVAGTCVGTACPDKNTNPDGDGDGLGDCVGDSCEEEGGGGPHDWYQAGEDTYASVIEDFAGRVSDMPAIAGVDNFLTFTPSGTCPIYTVDVWVFNLRIDQFCTGEIPWDLIRAIVLGCCAFFAFRIAFL